MHNGVKKNWWCIFVSMHNAMDPTTTANPGFSQFQNVPPDWKFSCDRRQIVFDRKKYKKANRAVATV